jgi:hypothetical protein
MRMKKFYSLSCLFLLLILWSATPVTSQNSVQAGKTVSGINGVPVTSVQVTFENELLGAVLVSWECTPSVGFMYYALQRDGLQIALFPTAMTFIESLPQYGTYTYCVIAMYTTGPATPTCETIEWMSPTMVWTPSQLTATLFSAMNKYVTLYIGNTGDGTLAFEFPDYTDHPGDSPLAYCPASATDVDEFISGVQLATINSSSGWNGYSDYTSLSTDLVKELSYPVSVTVGPPSYSGDITGVWIDFDHSNTFDTSEFFALTGISPATGSITVPATAITGPATMRVRTQWNGTLSPCGTTQYGEVEDYTLNLREPSFITSVNPPSGNLLPGQYQDVHTHFSAIGDYADTGVYTNILKLTSNDANQPLVNVTATMVVGMPSYLNGIVTDAVTGNPLPGVLVQAGIYSSMTNDDGEYSFQMVPGTYNVVFSKLGLQSMVMSGVVVTFGGVATLNAQLFETPYPPACAYASVDLDDSACTVSWCLPAGPYEMLYDDGTLENYAVWALPGNMNAVKFTPKGYPADITGARFHVTYQGTGSILSSTLTALVFTADAAGLPGDIIDSTTVIVTNLGWIDVTGLNATITSGDFFIVMQQNEPAPECPFLSVDETLPTAYKSYSRDVVNGGAWELSANQDLMIRAIVSSPDSGSDNHYSLTRVWLGAVNPVPPANGIPTLFSNSFSSTTYVESGTTWANLAQGWYAFGIQAHNYGEYSELTYTNMVPHKMFADLTINAQLECGLVPAEGAIVTLSGLYYPYYSVKDTIASIGTITFNQVIQGNYNVTITYNGYDTYDETVSLYSNEVVNTILLQSRNKPINFQVNNNNLVASWQEPRGILLNQNFESSTFPPSGWQSSTQGVAGWFSTTNGSSDSLVIPPHTRYAVINDELNGVSSNGCCDYLITPAIDLRGAPDYTLTFNSFFNGLGGQLAYVEMSTDTGTTWTPVYTCYPTGGYWLNETIDLSAYSGPSGSAGVMFAFHADDAGNQASGWAIDDVSITYGGLDVSGYKVYLDGTEMGQTTGLSWPFDPATFNCAQYQAAVEAIYCTGISEQATDDFTNGYAYPPSNLVADTSISATSGAVILSWQMPLNCLSNVVSYRIYRNDTALIADVPVTDTLYLDLDLLPGTYCYKMTSVYDLTPWGFPGLLGESVFSTEVCADLIYGGDLPFSDDFSGGAFDTTMWNPGQNWLVDEDSDNPVPAAKFKWDPLMTNYSSALESFYFDISSENYSLPFKVWFDYDIRLEDQLASSSEKLTVEVWDGTTWNPVHEYTNTGSFAWKTEHLNITSFATEQPFKVRFRANGSSSDAIQYWAIDNVDIYTQIQVPGPLDLVAQLLNPSGNDIKLKWASPSGAVTVMSYILDDNTAETGISFNSAGEYWTGNEFTVSEQGVLQMASVFLNENGSATYSFDVFDESKTLVGSSALFTPEYGGWTEVALPDIPYYGKFYLMLHLVVSSQSAILAYDTNGPNTVSDPEWFYDGSGWSKLSTNGIAPGVCMIRATGLVESKKTLVSFSTSSPVTGYVSPLKSRLVYNELNINTDNEITQAKILGVNNDSITGYNVYRRSYSVYPAGQNNTNIGDWTKIAFVVPPEYIDSDLSNLITNCYEYQVTAVYTEGESFPSNIDWKCIFTDVKPNPGNEVKLYPNPATTFIRVELNGNISDLKVYNSLGLMVAEKNIAGETTVMLNTSGYAAGMYTAKFTTRNGESFSRKFVVVR